MWVSFSLLFSLVVYLFTINVFKKQIFALFSVPVSVPVPGFGLVLFSVPVLAQF